MTSQPGSGRFIWFAVVGMFGLALVGVVLLGVALFTLMRPAASAPLPSATPIATQIAVIPPTTPAPPADTQVPPQTEVPPTSAAATTQAPEAASPTNSAAALEVKITLPANVRSGPGLTYPAIGGLNKDSTAPLIGRDSSAQWFAISYTGGTGWVSNQVAVYAGDTNSLPVIQPSSPPPAAATVTRPPAPTNTAPPAGPTNTPVPSGARGIVANMFQVENTTVGIGADIWFDFQVVNTSGQEVSYGALAAHTDAGFTAASWTQEKFTPGQSLTWRDHLNISTAGTYQVYLGICFASKESCLSGASPWDRLSSYVTVVVQ